MSPGLLPLLVPPSFFLLKKQNKKTFNTEWYIIKFHVFKVIIKLHYMNFQHGGHRSENIWQSLTSTDMFDMLLRQPKCVISQCTRWYCFVLDINTVHVDLGWCFYWWLKFSKNHWSWCTFDQSVTTCRKMKKKCKNIISFKNGHKEMN